MTTPKRGSFAPSFFVIVIVVLVDVSIVFPQNAPSITHNIAENLLTDAVLPALHWRKTQIHYFDPIIQKLLHPP